MGCGRVGMEVLAQEMLRLLPDQCRVTEEELWSLQGTARTWEEARGSSGSTRASVLGSLEGQS